MELDDFIKLDKDEQLEIVSTYKSLPIGDRLEIDFETHLQDYTKCENCGKWYPDDYVNLVYEERICEECINDGYGC